MGLTNVIVQDGTGHGAILDHFLALGQGVNANQVDVLANGTTGSADSLGSTQSHTVVVAEHDLNFVAELCQSGGHDFLTLGGLPVAHVLNQALGLDTGIGQSLDGVLGTILSIRVLGIADNHDVLHDAVAVDVALIVQSQNHLTLISTGLTGISADIADLGVVDDAGVGLVGLAQRLTVDKNQRNVGSNDLVDDDFRRGGLNQVADNDVHLLGDEGLNLVGLLGHITLAVDHGNLILDLVGFQSLEVVLDFLTVQGHEVVVVLIDGDADLVGLDIGAGSGTGRQRQRHNQNQDNCDELFHWFLLLKWMK